MEFKECLALHSNRNVCISILMLQVPDNGDTEAAVVSIVFNIFI